MKYVLKQLEGMNRYLTNLDSTTTDRFDDQVDTVKVLRQQCAQLTTSHNTLTDTVKYLMKQIQDKQHEWEAWKEWTPSDQDQDGPEQLHDNAY